MMPSFFDPPPAAMRISETALTQLLPQLCLRSLCEPTRTGAEVLPVSSVMRVSPPAIALGSNTPLTLCPRFLTDILPSTRLTHRQRLLIGSLISDDGLADASMTARDGHQQRQAQSCEASAPGGKPWQVRQWSWSLATRTRRLQAGTCLVT